MSHSKNQILIMGHRGASAIAPENTLKAFEKAIDLKADFIEFDVRETLDGELVIFHDEDIKRITGHDGIISKMTLNELKILDFGEGEKIPTLEELVKLTKNRIKLNCEITVTGITEKVIEILRKENLIQNSIVSCFMFDELLKLKEIEPNVKIGFLLPAELVRSRIIKRKILKCEKEGFYAIHPHFSTVDKEIVDFAHTNGLKVNVWTVNDRNSMKNLIQMGIDGIITDDISLAHKTISS